MTEIAGIENSPYAYAYSPNFRDAGADHPYWGDREFTGSSAVKKSKRATQEETFTEFDVLESDTPASRAEKSPQAPLFRRMITAIKDPYFREDLGFNFVHYFLVPASAVALFAIFVYAEVVRSTGY